MNEPGSSKPQSKKKQTTGGKCQTDQGKCDHQMVENAGRPARRVQPEGSAISYLENEMEG